MGNPKIFAPSRKGWPALFGTNTFISIFLSLLLLTFMTDARVWPFMACDMFAGNFDIVELYGKTRSGEILKIDAEHYFKYLKGYLFLGAMHSFYKDSPEQFSHILHELKVRYNQSSIDPIEFVRAYAVENGGRDQHLLGDFF